MLMWSPTLAAGRACSHAGSRGGCFCRRLQIPVAVVVADIGWGTGLSARGLAQHAAAVVCVEPSAAMLAQVPASDRLIPVRASAEDVAAGRVALPHDGYDAVLLQEMLHHVADRP